MRFAAQKTIHFQDMLPADGSIYMPDLTDKGGSMMKALRDWEKRRGLSFSLKGKFFGLKSQKTEENKEKTKPKQTTDRPIVVPRDPVYRAKPGRRPEFTKEERRLRKNESNKRARDKNREYHAAKSREWRAKLSEEQKQEILRKNREWRRARKAKARAAADAANGGGATQVPLADTSLSGKKRAAKQLEGRASEILQPRRSGGASS